MGEANRGERTIQSVCSDPAKKVSTLDVGFQVGAEPPMSWLRDRVNGIIPSVLACTEWAVSGVVAPNRAWAVAE